MYSGKDNPCGLGFPIRKSADQRVLAPPRSLSQRATSFIACVRQGIPQTPLHKRLIAQHSFHAQKEDQRPATRTLNSIPRWFSCDQIECLQINRSCKPANPAFTMSEILRVPARAICTRCRQSKLLFSVEECRGGGACNQEQWWSRSGSNRRPEACKATALPTELRPRVSISSIGASPCAAWQQRMVGPERVERSTSRLSGVRSNHLSYEPE